MNIPPFITHHRAPSPATTLLLLAHGPRRAAAQRGQVWLLLLHLQHQHQAGVLVTEEVEQEHQEVVDDVGLVALPARVHVDGQAGVPQGQPLRGVQGRRRKQTSLVLTELNCHETVKEENSEGSVSPVCV